MVNESFGHSVNEAVLDFLAKQRGTDSDAHIVKRRKKINVIPGKSISVEDILLVDDNKPSEKTSRATNNKNLQTAKTN